MSPVHRYPVKTSPVDKARIHKIHKQKNDMHFQPRIILKVLHVVLLSQCPCGRYYFSLCSRGAITTTFPCVAIKKIAPREKVKNFDKKFSY